MLEKRPNHPAARASRVPRALTQDERRLAEILGAAGLARPAARCLALLARGGWWMAAELADAGLLTPQEVSEGTRALDAKGVLRKEPVPREGPGRPPLRYQLALDAKTALAKIESEARVALERDLELLGELRDRLAK